MNFSILFSLLCALVSTAAGQYYYGYGYGYNGYRQWNPVRGAVRGALIGGAFGRPVQGALVGAALGKK